MDPLAIVLGIVALAALGISAFLLVQRAQHGARAAVAEEGRRAAEEIARRHETACDELEQALREAERRLADAAAEAARLAEALRSAQHAHTEGIAAERRLAEQRVADTARLHARELQALQEAHARTESLLKEYDTTLRQSFGKLAADALKHSSEQFLSLAQQKLAHASAESAADLEKRREAVERLVKPISDTLQKTDEKLQALEKERVTSYASLAEQVRAMQSEGTTLRTETAKLVKALREPQVRGRYGEVQLKRVAELAGMRAYCDFAEQSSVMGDDGTVRRPDMIIRLPNGRELVVDAKANLKPYLDALDAQSPDEVEACLRRFADGIADQARKLARKGYYADYDGSAEITVMFVPGDQFVDAALAKRPDLLDVAASHNVILASPGSLIALLRAVAVGFAEARLTKETLELRDLGKQLHDRASIALDHVAKLGRALETTVKSYNAFVSSYESRLEPAFRQFEAAGVKSSKELPKVEQVTIATRSLALTDRPLLAEPDA
jgi:DNA recombination protein RmuC